MCIYIHLNMRSGSVFDGPWQSWQGNHFTATIYSVPKKKKISTIDNLILHPFIYSVLLLIHTIIS